MELPACGRVRLEHQHTCLGRGQFTFYVERIRRGQPCAKTQPRWRQNTVEELWANSLMRIHFTNAVRVGDLIYGSSGDFGPAPFTAVDVKTGKIAWRHRSFPRASFLFADGRFIILDEDGHLLLATGNPEGLTVTSKVELLKSQSWTVPSLSGTRLYVRDRKNIVALELGPQ